MYYFRKEELKSQTVRSDQKVHSCLGSYEPPSPPVHADSGPPFYKETTLFCPSITNYIYARMQG